MTFIWLLIEAGAVYNPVVVIVPTTGAIDQVTGPPVAVNCCEPPPDSVAVAGDTVTGVGGCNVTVAVPNTDGSAVLVAVTVMFCWTPTDAGAVYSPEAPIDPTAGEIDHDTAPPEAVNCCEPPPDSVAVDGETVTGGGAVPPMLNQRSTVERFPARSFTRATR